MQNYFITPIVTSDRILYTPSAFAKSSLLYLQEIGSLVANKAHISRRSNLQSYLFFIVKRGAGELVYDKVQYELKTGDCVFIDCEKSYSHATNPDDLWSLSWIHFCGSTMPGIYEKYVSRGGRPVFRPSNTDSFLEFYTNLFSISSSNDYIRDMRINSYLNGLLVLLMAESWNPEEQGNKRKSMLPVKVYLDEHYKEKIMLDELAEKFYINKYYMTRLFKEQYGVSINTYIQEVKITKAKQMLRFTDNTLENIGVECGIGEPNYFSRLFKKIEGMTPSEYRLQWKTK